MEERNRSKRLFLGFLGAAFGLSGVFALRTSTHHGGLTSFLLFLVGWPLVVLGFWCLAWFAVIEFAEFVSRSDRPAWVLRGAVYAGFAALYAVLLFVTYRM